MNAASHLVAGSGPVISLTVLSVHPEVASAAARKMGGQNAFRQRETVKNSILMLTRTMAVFKHSTVANGPGDRAVGLDGSERRPGARVCQSVCSVTTLRR